MDRTSTALRESETRDSRLRRTGAGEGPRTGAGSRSPGARPRTWGEAQLAPAMDETSMALESETRDAPAGTLGSGAGLRASDGARRPGVCARTWAAERTPSASSALLVGAADVLGSTGGEAPRSRLGLGDRAAASGAAGGERVRVCGRCVAAARGPSSTSGALARVLTGSGERGLWAPRGARCGGERERADRGPSSARPHSSMGTRVTYGGRLYSSFFSLERGVWRRLWSLPPFSAKRSGLDRHRAQPQLRSSTPTRSLAAMALRSNRTALAPRSALKMYRVM